MTTIFFSIYDQCSDTLIPDFNPRFYVYYDYYSLDGERSIKEVLNTPMENALELP